MLITAIIIVCWIAQSVLAFYLFQRAIRFTEGLSIPQIITLAVISLIPVALLPALWIYAMLRPAELNAPKILQKYND